MTERHEYVIIGSGAGGATLARELSRRDRSVLVVEKGIDEKSLGTFKDASRYYDTGGLIPHPKRSKEGVILWRTFMAGGSTMASCGNGVRCLEKELGELGVSLEDEFQEAEAEMNVTPIADELLSEASRRIMEAASDLGYNMEPMPKFIDARKCDRCGQCAFGCKRGAKWTARDYLKEAQKNGAKVLYESEVDKVVIEGNRAQGVRGSGPRGEFELLADTVIVAAGGFSSPAILQRSGLEEVGEGLFIDMLVNVYGLANGFNQLSEPTMALVDHSAYEKGFILSPYINAHRMVRSFEKGVRGFLMPTSRLVGIMIKSRDDATGRIYPDESVSKPVTDADWTRLQEGAAIATEMLIKAGASEKSIVITRPQGAHPGGTCAMGKVVDRDLKTQVEGLFVCDGSVLPTSPGMPPILTIVALAKRLAGQLAHA
jgi:choline dehydrogenase-like flavoprotein